MISFEVCQQRLHSVIDRYKCMVSDKLFQGGVLIAKLILKNECVGNRTRCVHIPFFTDGNGIQCVMYLQQ